MGSTADKVSGYANEVAGNIKKNLGKAVGSDKMRVEGALQELKGEAQVEVGKAKATVKDGANKVADEINRKL
ncbi:CsbD family protein [Hyphomicrobium sp.]|uniref:CsbD family protein n=1 Tax=Hyphomicrobium sp. TaxID=82 RepID=UPI001DA0BE59|nr:CsbD family protein [Hyphomicrobium sp.]MBY0559758.1 CsbD family protein [Hyphomicrobium sp.]